MFQRRKFFQGRPIRGTGIKDLSWFGPDGQEMSDDAWDAGYVKCLGVRLAGDEIGDQNERGEPLVGDTILLLLNAHHEAIPFALPAARPEHHWLLLLDTSKARSEPAEMEPVSSSSFKAAPLRSSGPWLPQRPQRRSLPRKSKHSARTPCPPAAAGEGLGHLIATRHLANATYEQQVVPVACHCYLLVSAQSFVAWPFSTA